ncbi:MAG: hypothetical protein M1415_07685 [Firmicutes bacterium]|jgi:hypothetical protein|nr:hypothetical protein [Bacillota bacterium]
MIVVGSGGTQVPVIPGQSLSQTLTQIQQQAQQQALNIGTLPSATQQILGQTGTALVAIATGLSMIAMFIALFRLMAGAHNPRRRQQSMTMLGDSSLVLVLLFGMTTVVGIFATVYLHFIS